MSDKGPYSLPIKITTAEDGTPSVVLGGMELSRVLATRGVSIKFVDDFGGISVPEITLTFGAGALELDFDVELLERLLADTKAS